MLRVSDSGLGFAATSVECSTGLGLVSMAERVRSVGGALSVQSEVNRGTHIEASIPMPPHAQANSKTFTISGRSDITTPSQPAES
jgi:signal transduction histidine kinase